MKRRKLTRREFLSALGGGAIALALPSLLVLAARGPAAAARRGRQGAGKIRVEGFDSGTRVVREVAEALTGRGRSILECYPPGSEFFLWLLSFLPEDGRIAGIEWGISLGVGNSPKRLEGFDPSSLPEWCIEQYPADGYEAIIVGSPNGGIAHLAALLRAPFLTTSFELSFRHRPFEPDELQRYHESGKGLAEAILNKGEGIEVINHYDPLHDRSLVRYVNRLRVKWVELPEAYQGFILENLAPRGKIVLVECGWRWPQYLVADRSFLQVGGLGGVSPEEYLERWELDLPLLERRESEWGCPEGFASSVRDFAARRGIELLEIGLDHPQDYSLLAYRAYLESAGARRGEILFDCFNHQNPRTNVQTGIPALWLPFNAADSLAFAQGFLEGREFERIYLTLLPSFSRSPDTVPLERWVELLSRHGELELLGTDPRLFPADTLAPFRFAARMRGLRRRHRLPKPLKLDLSALEVALQEEGGAD